MCENTETETNKKMSWLKKTLIIIVVAVVLIGLFIANDMLEDKKVNNLTISFDAKIEGVTREYTSQIAEQKQTISNLTKVVMDATTEDENLMRATISLILSDDDFITGAVNNASTHGVKTAISNDWQSAKLGNREVFDIFKDAAKSITGFIWEIVDYRVIRYAKADTTRRQNLINDALFVRGIFTGTGEKYHLIQQDYAFERRYGHNDLYYQYDDETMPVDWTAWREEVNFYNWDYDTRNGFYDAKWWHRRSVQLGAAWTTTAVGIIDEFLTGVEYQPTAPTETNDDQQPAQTGGAPALW